MRLRAYDGKHNAWHMGVSCALVERAPGLCTSSCTCIIYERWRVAEMLEVVKRCSSAVLVRA